MDILQVVFMVDNGGRSSIDSLQRSAQSVQQKQSRQRVTGGGHSERGLAIPCTLASSITHQPEVVKSQVNRPCPPSAEGVAFVFVQDQQ